MIIERLVEGRMESEMSRAAGAPLPLVHPGLKNTLGFWRCIAKRAGEEAAGKNRGAQQLGDWRSDVGDLSVKT